MSTHWKEETITTVQRTFIKGNFTGKYNAQRNDAKSSHHTEYFLINIYEAEIHLEKARKDFEGDFPEAVDLPPFGGTFTQPVSCYDPQSGSYFKLTIEQPRVANPLLSKIMKEGSEHMGTISGTIYGYLAKTITENIRMPVEPIISSNSSIAHQTDISLQWIRTSTFENAYFQGTLHQRYSYRSGSGNYRWGNWYIVNEPWSWRSFFRTLTYIGCSLFLFGFLINLFWPGIVVLGLFLLVSWLLGGGRNGVLSRLFSLFFSSVSFLLLFGLGIGLFRAIDKTSTKPAIINPQNTTKIKPITITRPDHKQPIAKDAWIIHHQVWTDLEGNNYMGDIKILKSVYEEALRQNTSLNDVRELSDVYRSMTVADSSRLHYVYPLFDSLRRARNLDSLQFASMLVGFVQSIPYSKVQESDCGSVTDERTLSAEFGSSSDRCLGNIRYGVQSPAAFMGNFQGDCDTRTLFLFTLLNHYRYKVAILGSEAFKHSLIGLALPMEGSYKMVGTERFVLWETTSAGFKAGQLAPEIDQMDYWQFDLINSI